jgi:hypothetical protein
MPSYLILNASAATVGRMVFDSAGKGWLYLDEQIHPLRVVPGVSGYERLDADNREEESD